MYGNLLYDSHGITNQQLQDGLLINDIGETAPLGEEK